MSSYPPVPPDPTTLPTPGEIAATGNDPMLLVMVALVVIAAGLIGYIIGVSEGIDE